MWPQCYAPPHSNHIATVAARDLRNHTAAVLRQVADGTSVVVTVNGTPVAEVVPVRSSRPQFFSRAELTTVLMRYQADPALRDELEVLAGDTTDDLDEL